MDIEQALVNARNAAQAGAVYVLAEAINSIDEWLSRGGFLPEDWQPGTIGSYSGDDGEARYFVALDEPLSRAVLRAGVVLGRVDRQDAEITPEQGTQLIQDWETLDEEMSAGSPMPSAWALKRTV